MKCDGNFLEDGVHGDYVKVYFDNGSIMHSGRYENGIKEGYARKYHRNGKIHFLGLFKTSLPSGKTVEIKDADGSIKYTGEFKFDVFYKY